MECGRKTNLSFPGAHRWVVGEQEGNLDLMVTCSPRGGRWRSRALFLGCGVPVPAERVFAHPEEAGGPHVYLLGVAPAPECWAQLWN